MYEKYEQNYTSFEAFFLEKNKGSCICARLRYYWVRAIKRGVSSISKTVPCGSCTGPKFFIDSALNSS